MFNANQSCPTQNQKDPHAMQDAAVSKTLQHIKNKILVMSGKGGVGKSSVSAFLALMLARRGFRVGLMDVDLHGPSIPRLLGLTGNIQASDNPGKAKPISLSSHLEVISIEALLGDDKDVATIWRGPLKIGVIKQFLADIEWSDLDYLIIDSPPGTGDEPLTVAQTIPDAQALIVTTPQEISLADVRKSINFCRQVNMRILGLVENMNGLQCPHCGKDIALFNTNGGRLLAEHENLSLLASLPFDPDVVKMGDAGNLAGLTDEVFPFSTAFRQLVAEVEKLNPTTSSLVVDRSNQNNKSAGGTSNAG